MRGARSVVLRAPRENGTPVSGRLKWGLYVVLVGATLLTLPIANKSLNAWLGL